jgi:putative MATE family efflux protein
MRGDMTSGNPARQLIKFALPMVLGNLFQQLYNIADTIIVGNFVGAAALAAVGSSATITFLFIAIATGASIGSSVVISQFFGANKLGKMKTAISTIIITMLIIGTFASCLGLLSHRLILKAMNTPPEIFESSATYLSFYFMGLLFLFLFNTLNAIFNGLGLSRIPLCFLIFASFVNIGLDLLFVIQFDMGVAGVAIATLIAQGLSAVLSFAALIYHIKKMKIKEEFTFFDFAILKKISKIAIPSIMQQSIVSIGAVMVQALVNRYGSIVIAGYAAASKIDNIAIMPMVNIGSAMSTFTGQHIGAKKTERISKGLQGAVGMVWVLGIVIALALYLFGRQFVGLFVDANTDQAVIEVGTEYLRVVSVFYVIMGTMNNVNGVMRGAGDMKFFLAATLCGLATRVILAYALVYLSPMGYHSIWWSIPIGWGVGMVIAITRYRSGAWKTIKVLK